MRKLSQMKTADLQLISVIWKVKRVSKVNLKLHLLSSLQSLLLYLVIEPVLPIQSAKVIHGENVPFVIDPKCFGHS